MKLNFSTMKAFHIKYTSKYWCFFGMIPWINAEAQQGSI